MSCRISRVYSLLKYPAQPTISRMWSNQTGDWGSGAGKGGGSGGAVREAGGSFGKMEAAHEEQYFRKLQKEQIEKLKDHMEEEIVHHKTEIKRHQEEIERHKERIQDLHKDD